MLLFFLKKCKNRLLLVAAYRTPTIFQLHYQERNQDFAKGGA